MKEIIVYNNRKKKAQYAPAKNIYNFFDDKNDEELNPNVVDFDKLENEQLPEIKFDDINYYLADNFQEEKTFDEELSDNIEAPITFTDDELPEFKSTEEALNWAAQNNQVVRINYTTKKGIDLTRIVEPHAIFFADTGNMIVVTYDRSVQDIRAYIVQNILNYIFTGKEYKNRMKIIPGMKKEKIAMKNNVFKNFKEIQNDLEKLGLSKSAEIVKKSMTNLSKIKTAQYTGAQGYWIRNKRCWDNCYRHKRLTKPDTPAQVVFGECWDEYLKSIDNINQNKNDDNWAKYADIKDKKIKTAKIEKEENLFKDMVIDKISQGISKGEAIYSSIEEGKQRYIDTLISDSDILLELAANLKHNGFHEESRKAAHLSLSLVKEAQNSPFGHGGVKGWAGRLWDKYMGDSKEDPKIRKLIDRIGAMLRYVSYFAQQLNTLNYTLKSKMANQQGVHKEGQDSGIVLNPPSSSATPTTDPSITENYQKELAEDYVNLVDALAAEKANLSTMAARSKNPQIAQFISKITNSINAYQTSSKRYLKQNLNDPKQFYNISHLIAGETNKLTQSLESSMRELQSTLQQTSENIAPEPKPEQMQKSELEPESIQEIPKVETDPYSVQPEKLNIDNIINNLEPLSVLDLKKIQNEISRILFQKGKSARTS